MKFLVSVIDNQTRSPHTPQEIQAIDDFNDKLSAHGQRIFAGGLDSPSSAIVFDNRNGANKSSEGSIYFIRWVSLVAFGSLRQSQRRLLKNLLPRALEVAIEKLSYVHYWVDLYFLLTIQRLNSPLLNS